MSSKNSGKFIVIDGSDGSGKATQSEILIKRLKEAGYEVAFYDFPQYEETFFGKMVGRYLNGEFGEADDVSPYLASLLYAGDRWQASKDIQQDLDDGKIVISNRYTQSNMGFQSAKFDNKADQQKFLSWISELEFNIYKIPKPSAVVYLYVPYEISQLLVDKKQKRSYTDLKRDIHEKNSDFLRRVEKSYLSLAENYPEWRKIDCVKEGQILPIEEISNIVFNKVLKELEIK